MRRLAGGGGGGGDDDDDGGDGGGGDDDDDDDDDDAAAAADAAAADDDGDDDGAAVQALLGMLLSNGPTIYDAVTLVSNRMMTRMAQTQLYADSLQARAPSPSSRDDMARPFLKAELGKEMSPCCICKF